MSESTVEQSVLDDPGFIERRDELLVAVAEPLVRNVVGRKLARFNSRRGVGRLTPCPDDLTHDVLEELTRSLNTAPPDSPLWEKAVFVRYAARAAENRCHDLYRDDLPERERLRRKVYRALKIHRSFASWESGGRVVCGFARWRGRDPDPKAAARLDEGDVPQAPPPGAGKSALTIARIAALLNRAGGPVEAERVVRVIYELYALDKGGDSSLSEDGGLLRRIPAPGRTGDGLACEDLLRAYCSALCDLPPRQRVAVALTQADAAGDCLLQYVLSHRVATWGEVSRSLGLTPEQVQAIGDELPASYEAVAGILGVSPAGARKLRCRGWRRVRERLIAGAEKDISAVRE